MCKQVAVAEAEMEDAERAMERALRYSTSPEPARGQRVSACSSAASALSAQAVSLRTS